MLTPGDLTREQLKAIVGRIQSILWLDPTTDAFDPDRSWDVETIEWVSGVLEDFGLRPGTTSPTTGVVPESTDPGAQPEGGVPEGIPSGTSGSKVSSGWSLHSAPRACSAAGACEQRPEGCLRMWVIHGGRPAGTFVSRSVRHSLHSSVRSIQSSIRSSVSPR